MLIGYARVSTIEQSLDLQIDALLRAGCERSLIFTDTISGTKAKRPGLDDCLQALRDGDTLIVWKLDRLARSVSSLIKLLEHFKEREINLSSLTEGIDARTAGGKLMLHLLCVFAQFERDLIVERTCAGLQAAKARGRELGRPKKLTAAKMKKADRLIAGGMSVKKAAKEIDVAVTTLYGAIREAKCAAGLDEVDDITLPETQDK